MIVVTAFGLTATTLFHILLKGNLLENRSQSQAKTNPDESSWLLDGFSSPRRSWFGTSILLRVAMLYVASRLFITLATVYLPLYIEETAVGGKQALATVPLVSYLSSFIAALLLKYMNRSCGTKVYKFELFHNYTLTLQYAIRIFRSFDTDYYIVKLFRYVTFAELS